MNPKVEELISKKQEEIKSEKQKRRENHLIRLGLTADGTQRKYMEYYTNSPDCKWDEEKQMYYIGSAVAIDVTDEEYAEICKYYPEGETNVVENETYGAENTLKTIAGIILGIGIIATFIFIITVFATGMPFVIVLGAVILFLIILGSWAILRCFANISITLKEIKAKIK